MSNQQLALTKGLGADTGMNICFDDFLYSIVKNEEAEIVTTETLRELSVQNYLADAFAHPDEVKLRIPPIGLLADMWIYCYIQDHFAKALARTNKRCKGALNVE